MIEDAGGEWVWHHWTDVGGDLLFDMANQSILNFQIILNILNLSNDYLKVLKAYWKKQEH